MVFVYYDDQQETSFVGVRLVPVSCEKCGTDYCYELARVGTGVASAPYGVGRKGAARLSEEKAASNLGRRLDEEAELVPCPRCHWVNEGLVAGYRRGRYRGWGRFALGSAIAIASLSLIVAWALTIGPDRVAVLRFLVGGLPASLAFAAAVLLLRRWLRGRIDPNRDFPKAPARLPPGTPPALVKNPTTGDLEVARRKPDGKPAIDDQDEFGPGREKAKVADWVEIQVGRSQLPPSCVSCLAPSDPGSAEVRVLYRSVAFALPRCASCARGRKRTNRSIALATLAVAMALLIPAWWALNFNMAVFALAVAGVALVCLIVGVVVAEQWAPVDVRLIDRPRGVVRLRFRNPKYPRLIEESGG